MTDEYARILAVAEELGVPPGRGPDDPVVMEAIGAALAERLETGRGGVVAFWDTSRAAVLAHVVARHLEARVLAATEDLGRLYLSGAPGELERVVAIGVAWDGPARITSLLRLLAGRGYEVVAVGSVLAGDHHTIDAGLPFCTLESRPA